jgi:hypothetical protein
VLTEHDMISDVLFDTIKEIDRCLAEYPTLYQQDEEIHEAIREVQLRMRLLQMQLDQPLAPAIIEKT